MERRNWITKEIEITHTHTNEGDGKPEKWKMGAQSESEHLIRSKKRDGPKFNPFASYWCEKVSIYLNEILTSIRLFVKINLPICMFSGTVFAKMKKNCIFDSPWILICISKFSELRYGQGHTLLSLFHAYAGEQFLSMGLLLAWSWSWSKGVLQKKRLNDLFKWKPIFFYIRIWVEQGEKKTGLFTGNRK